MSTVISDRHSLFLLLSLVAYILLIPLLESNRIGEALLLVPIYVTLLAATWLLSAAVSWRWPAIVVAIASFFTSIAAQFYPIRELIITRGVFLVVFTGLLSVGLFSYLGRSGPVTPGRLYASVSLYLMLALLWTVIYALIEEIHPGSFTVTVTGGPGVGVSHAFMYLSLATLTTLGYGDIVPLSPLPRMLAALEAATGVLYIAITVARLVSDYQRPGRSA